MLGKYPNIRSCEDCDALVIPELPPHGTIILSWPKKSIAITVNIKNKIIKPNESIGLMQKKQLSIFMKCFAVQDQVPS
jgi:hypothetical protein